MKASTAPSGDFSRQHSVGSHTTNTPGLDIGLSHSERTETGSAQGAQFLTAYLAEYGWLKSEIAGRSDYQHRIVQIHVTALTLLLATGLSGSFSKWIILVIPIESAIFGLWWIDHARTIRTIGRYLSETIEPNIDKLFGRANVIAWERCVENPGENNGGMKKIVKGYQSVSDFTFFLPSVVILLICAVGASITSGWLPEWKFLEQLENAYARFFPLAEDFDRYRPGILTLAVLVGGWMFQRCLLEYVRFGKIVRQ